MSKTIIELTTQIEELEKRIRAISSAQTSLSQIIAMRDCIEQIKTYLEELNTTLDNIEDSASDAELEALKDRVTICEEDILALQTDLATTQDDISTLQSDLSATNQIVGEHTTIITNLQTTQTNLQTTQSSQASTISSIDNRLTTCENNVNSLSGGVDISDYEARLTELESGNSNSQTCCHMQYNLNNACISTNTFYTRNHVYSCAKNRQVYQYFKLCYNSTASGTLTITVLEDDVETGETFNINLETNPYECTFFRQFVSTTMSRNIQLKLVADTTITYKTLDFWLFGNNVTIYDNNRDIKAFCFDGNIYITRYKNGYIYYGKFTSGDEIDLDNLPNNFTLNNQQYCANYIIFAPYTYFNSSTLELKTYEEDSFHLENAYENKYYCLNIVDNAIKSILDFGNNVVHSSEYVISNYQYNFAIEIISGVPRISLLSDRGNYGYLSISTKMPEEWLYVNGEIDNFRVSTQTCKTLANVTSVAKYADGYFYYITARTFPNYVQLCKGGNSATAYKQQDESINVYVNFDTYVKKYNIVNLTATFVEDIQDCTCVYEILDTHLIKRNIAGIWSIESIATNSATEET